VDIFNEYFSANSPTCFLDKSGGFRLYFRGVEEGQVRKGLDFACSKINGMTMDNLRVEPGAFYEYNGLK
jgi:hypothetical protein